MGEIGEYIHLHIKNYQTYGTHRVGETPDPPASYDASKLKAVKESIKERALNNVTTPFDVQQLKTNIAQIFSEPGPNGLNYPQSIIQEEMEQNYLKAFQGMDWSKGKAMTNPDYINNLNNLRNQFSQILTDKDKTKEDVLRDIDNRITNIQTIIRDNFEGYTSFSRLNNVINQINIQYQNIVQNYAQGTKDTLLTSIKAADSTFEMRNSRGKKVTDGSLASNITYMYQQLKNAIPISNQNGDLGEYPVSLAWAMGQNIAQDQLKTTMENQVKGDVKTKKAIKLELFGSEFQNSLQEALTNHNWTYSFSNGSKLMLAPSASQQKVDISAEFAQHTQKNVNFSVKNYALSGRGGRQHLQILSGSPLLLLIQEEDSNFINHYLNLTAAHSTNLSTDESSAASALQNLKTQVQETMQAVIVYKALSGDVLQDTSSIDFNPVADTFIILDNNKTGPDSVYIFSVSDIINRIAAENARIDLYATITDQNSHPFNDIDNFKNEWAEAGPEQRITNLLMDVLNRKISVSLNSSSLLNMPQFGAT